MHGIAFLMSCLLKMFWHFEIFLNTHPFVEENRKRQSYSIRPIGAKLYEDIYLVIMGECRLITLIIDTQV